MTYHKKNASRLGMLAVHYQKMANDKRQSQSVRDWCTAKVTDLLLRQSDAIQKLIQEG